LWVQRYVDIDFKEHKTLFKLLVKFANTVPGEKGNGLKLLCMKNPTFTHPLLDEIRDITKLKKVVPSGGTGANSPVFCWPISVWAQQLTLRDSLLYRSIKPQELLNQSWQKEDKAEKAPTLALLTDNFNRLSYWAATEIVLCESVQEQTSILKTFVVLMNKLFELNNFHSMMAIMAALNMSAIQRLKRVWESVPRYKAEFEKMEEMMSGRNNFRVYRHYVKDLQERKGTVIVPYLPVHLRDLTFINDGNANTIVPKGGGDPLPNFEKMKLLGTAILELQGFFKTEYDFKLEEGIQQFLLNLRFLDEDELHAKSLELQPIVEQTFREEAEEGDDGMAFFSNPLLNIYNQPP